MTECSPYISAELAATCDALGYYDGHKYHLDKNCMEVIKDLIKYLRRDDSNHVVRRYLGHSKIVQTDLIKIFIDHSDKKELWDVLLRLMINLTSPALMFYNEELPTEKVTRTLYQEIVSHLQGYKVSLTDERVWSTIRDHLGKLLSIDTAERGEENEIIIERILTFVRNVLQVPPADNETRADNDATVHDELLFALNSSGTVDLLLFIASNRSEQHYHMQILEIIALMLREQNASKLATVGTQRSTIEKEQDEAKLSAIREKERNLKMEKIKKYAGSRHSRFGGTYVVQNMKAIGENQLICHKPYQKIEALEFGTEKAKVRKPKNKRAMADTGGERISAYSVRLFLKEFCVEFLNGAYNSVMRYARSCINSTNAGSPMDASYYLWAMRFFMEFNRHYKFHVKYVSETISTEIFHVVQRQMEQYYEMLSVEKKKTHFWSRRLHLALKAYQELLHTILAMDKSDDKGVQSSSNVIKSNIFYVPEYRETILSQLLCFNELKMSRGYLVDLTTTAHIFLKMLEHFCGKSRTLIVQAKKKRSQKRKSQKKSMKETPQAPPVPLSLEDRWDDVGPELSAVMQTNQIPVVVPFDATLDTPIDEQKSDAMKKTQKLLRHKEFEEAIGLFRAAREVWPENDSFGSANMLVEEEFLALREIFFADLGVPDETPSLVTQEEQEESLSHDDEEEEDEEEEAERELRTCVETDFEFKDFLIRFANMKVVKAMALLLQGYEMNSIEVNHYIVKMLHRIAWDCKMQPMIYQASIFRTFQRILDSKSSEHKELQKFAIFIIRSFAEVAQKNRKAYMELLFWKTTHHAVDMVEGYDSQGGENKKLSRTAWSEEEEDELRTLFMEHQTNKYPQDLIDWLLDNLINKDRTRRAVIKKLKEMCLIVNSKGVRSEIQKRLPKEWSEEEVAQLTELWEQVKEEDDPVDLIYDGLRIKRPKAKIKEKLLELELAKDRKELRKKRTKKSNAGPKSTWETASRSGTASDSDSNRDGSRSSRNALRKTAKQNKSKKQNKKQPTILYSDGQLSGLLKDVIENNMQEALEWIKESLEESLEDRDEESDEGIPVVPLTADTSAAMDSPSFQRLIRAMGIEPPDLEQAYWRIPASMLTATIKKRCTLIEAALRGEFVAEDSKKATAIDSDSEDDGDVLENLKKYFKKSESQRSISPPLNASENLTIPENGENSVSKAKSSPRASNKAKAPVKKGKKKVQGNIGISSDSEADLPVLPKKAKGKGKSKAARLEKIDISPDSEIEDQSIPSSMKSNSNRNEGNTSSNPSRKIDISSDSEAESAKIEHDRSDKENSQKGKSKTGRIQKMVDSSDSETEVTNLATQNLEESKRDRSQNSDTDTPLTKKRRVFQSDEEDEPESVKTQDAKQARRIVSDDED
ncbi:protein timeless homolog [Belonocnema kinseyi]|uniref:protein timeless homolog n=1 Tax=Belonocnema kinseyi TaxID=2817044 RepID=UPI00143D5711|nr:protein timeless homolog [Belonocnema kinseyi]